MNLAESIDFHARARPDRIAIVKDDAAVSYRQLAARIRASAGALRAVGIREGSLVGVCLKDTIDHLVIIYALARMGAVMMPMDWRWSAGEKERLIAHFGTEAVVVEGDAAPLAGCRNIAVDMVARGAPQDSAALDAPAAASADLPLLLSLSSGTTGRPKGPRITHEQMLRRFWTHWINLGLNSADRYVSATPLYFGGGRTFAMSVLFSGGTVVLFPPPFEVSALCDEVERQQATSAFLVPTQLRKLLELPPERQAAMRRLKLLISSGSPLYPDERQAIRERICENFVEYYASTEGGGVSISTPADQLRHGDSVGRAVFAVEMEIVDDRHRPLPHGTIGRLRYRGPGVATGYYADEAATLEAFRDGWYYPGDLGEMNAEGYVFLRGRSKDMIIRGGVNIHPGEIEMILSTHPAVGEAAVVGRPSKILGEEVVAFVVTRGDVTDEALAEWCRGKLAPYKMPAAFLRVGELPKNSAGKVLKSELAARLHPS